MEKLLTLLITIALDGLLLIALNYLGSSSKRSSLHNPAGPCLLGCGLPRRFPLLSKGDLPSLCSLLNLWLSFCDSLVLSRVET